VRDRERGVEREVRRVATATDLLLPERAGDVDQRAAAVAFAVDVAGAVQHLLQRVESLGDDVVRGAAVTADCGVERTRVLVLDGLRRAQRPVCLERRDACAALRLGRAAATGGAALRRVRVQIFLPDSAPSPSGRATGS
jgi:hypothetical protein